VLIELQAAIRKSGLSLRDVARRTNRSSRKIHHSNLSQALREKNGRRLDLEQFLVLAAVLGERPEKIIERAVRRRMKR